MNEIPWETIRRGWFCGDEYRIPCARIEEALELKSKINGRWSWNPDLGDYVGIGRSHPLWDTVCRMHS